MINLRKKRDFEFLEENLPTVESMLQKDEQINTISGEVIVWNPTSYSRFQLLESKKLTHLEMKNKAEKLLRQAT
jgi:hypothetical protein